MKIIYIDHYDSFSFNVIDWLTKDRKDIKIEYYPYDTGDLLSKLVGNNCPIVLSPGPNSPIDAPSTLEIVSRFIHKVPILGICLGHQILGFASGAKITKCKNPIHGVAKKIHIKKSKFLAEDCLNLAVYNSLCVSDLIDDSWEITGFNDEGEIQIIENWRNEDAPAIGIQAHPESFLSKDGMLIRDQWFKAIKY